MNVAEAFHRLGATAVRPLCPQLILYRQFAVCSFAVRSIWFAGRRGASLRGPAEVVLRAEPT